MQRSKKRCLRAWLMLITICLPFILTSGGVARAAITEAGGNDFCYVGDSNSGGSDGTGVATKDKVDTIPITVPDESKTGKAAMKEIADAIGEKLDIEPALIYAQMCQESGPNGDSQEAVNDKNFSGIKGSGGGVATDDGGTYQKFNSLSEYASRYAAILKNDGLSGIKDPSEYVHKLKQMGYFTASEADYEAGVKALMAGYYGADANGAAGAAGASGEDSANASGSWHKGDETFAPDSLDTTFTTGFGGGEEQQAQDNDDNAEAANSATGNWKDKNSSTYKNAKKIFNLLTKKMGFSGAGAAGVLGNFAIESSFNPQASNGTHFGIAQWSQDRLNAGNMKGYDSSTLTFDNEMKLMQKELNGSYKNAKDKVGHATSVKDAADQWDALYEQSGGASDGQREDAAQFFYKEFNAADIDANDSLLGAAADAADAGAASDDNSQSSKNSGACGGSDNGEASSGEWTWPFKNVPKSGPTRFEDGQQFGQTSYGRGGGNFHDGYDWGSAMYSGDILAVHGGTVYKIDNSDDGRGWHIDVKSPDGYYEIYQEFASSESDIKVKVGDNVTAGQPIAHLSTSHLHLGITRKEIEKAEGSWDVDDGTWLDPIKVIKGENIDQK